MDSSTIRKMFFNQRGMTLVEVMIAGSIGVAIFLYLNQTLVRFQKAQVRAERKMISREVQDSVIKILEDTDSWISNPEDDVPKRENFSNFYYFKTPGKEIEKVSYTLDELADLDRKHKAKVKNFQCPPALPKCRVLLFTYGNKMITEDSIAGVSTNHFRVAVGFQTKDKDISRSFLPEFKVQVMDTNTDNELRVNSKIMHVNSTGSKRSGNSSYIIKDGRKIDTKSRTKCFSGFLKISDNRTHGLNLCRNAISLAPLECYKSFIKEFGVDPSLALIACVNAKNIEAVRCFREARKVYKASETYLAIGCSAAESDLPLRCLSEIRKGGYDMSKVEPYKVCSRAQDLTPANCFNKLVDSSKENMDSILYLCPHHK